MKVAGEAKLVASLHQVPEDLQTVLRRYATGECSLTQLRRLYKDLSVVACAHKEVELPQVCNHLLRKFEQAALTAGCCTAVSVVDVADELLESEVTKKLVEVL